VSGGQTLTAFTGGLFWYLHLASEHRYEAGKGLSEGGEAVRVCVLTSV
jgi:hypothetical protein